MHKNHKTGFTLVELMVVIVIMGILAGVAIPKLTNSVTKAKASEVAPAANTYIKLQNAYVMEKKQVGTWRKIGYKKPKSDVFDYPKEKLGIQKRMSLEEANGKIGFYATNKVNLGLCSKGKEWTITLNVTSDDNSYYINYAALVNDDNCYAFTGDNGVVSKNSDVKDPQVSVKTSLGIQIYGSNTDGTNMSLAKALVSGKSSTNSTKLAGNFNSQYNIKGFVINEGTGSIKVNNEKGEEITLAAWVKEQVEKKTGKSTAIKTDGDRVKVITVTDDDVTVLAKGTRYKATQTIYYDELAGSGSKGNLVKLDAYGTREVWVENDDGKIKYYDSEKGGNEITDYTVGWKDPTETIEKDPATVIDWAGKENYKSRISEDVISATGETDSYGHFTLPKLIVSNVSTFVNASNILDDDGKQTTLREKFGIVGSVLNAEAANANMKTLLKSENGGKEPSKVRALTELHTQDAPLVEGTLYAATVNLYYGNDAKTLKRYATKEVYALAKSGSAVNYYSDKECKNQVDITGTSFWSSN